MENKLKEISIEDYVWCIYIFIAIFALISNKLEKRYYINNNKIDKIKYKKINRTILIIAIFLYIYFIYRNIKKDRNNTYYLSLFASILFFIGGILYLYSDIYSNINIELEV